MKQNNLTQPIKAQKNTNLVLLALLEEKGMHQTDLANSVFLDKAYINRIIHGREEAPEVLKIKIAKVLGVDSRVIFPIEKVEGGIENGRITKQKI